MDYKELGENIGLDEDEFIEMLDIFFESGSADLEKLDAAIREGNAGKAHEASHSLKGSAGNLGLEKIFEIAKAIDDKDREGSLEGLDEMVNDLRREYDLLVQDYKKHTGG